jgi:hypothetical protein
MIPTVNLSACGMSASPVARAKARGQKLGNPNWRVTQLAGETAPPLAGF